MKHSNFRLHTENNISFEHWVKAKNVEILEFSCFDDEHPEKQVEELSFLDSVYFYMFTYKSFASVSFCNFQQASPLRKKSDWQSIKCSRVVFSSIPSLFITDQIDETPEHKGFDY